MQIIYKMLIGTYQIIGLNAIYLGYIIQDNLFLCFVLPPYICIFRLCCCSSSESECAQVISLFHPASVSFLYLSTAQMVFFKRD